MFISKKEKERIINTEKITAQEIMNINHVIRRTTNINDVISYGAEVEYIYIDKALDKVCDKLDRLFKYLGIEEKEIEGTPKKIIIVKSLKAGKK